MSSNFTVIYDACVLYPAPLRDFLMCLALIELYRARWTDMIHDEWTRTDGCGWWSTHADKARTAPWYRLPDTDNAMPQVRQVARISARPVQ